MTYDLAEFCTCAAVYVMSQQFAYPVLTAKNKDFFSGLKKHFILILVVVLEKYIFSSVTNA